MLWKLLAVLITGAVLPPGDANAVGFGFGCLTNNQAGDCAIGEAQIAMDVTDEGGGQVRFTLTNSGPAASAIEGIYFDDGTLLGIASIVSGPGTRFSAGASPPELPGGSTATPAFVTTAGFLSDSDPPASHNGVGPGEMIAILFTLQGGGTFADVLAELADGRLRAGVHVIAYASGGSESLVNTPEPGTLVLALLGLGAISAIRQVRG